MMNSLKRIVIGKGPTGCIDYKTALIGTLASHTKTPIASNKKVLVTLLQMFQQYMSPYKSNGTNVLANVVLGVRQNDYMSGLDDLSTAIDAFVQQAQNSTAEVSVSPARISDQKLVADVKVINKTGHRFPSGVGFRRAFLEFRIVDNDSGQTVWCSGCTNELGVIVKGNERLASELFDVYTDGTK